MADVERVKSLVDESLGDTAFDEMGNMDANKAAGGAPKSQADRRKLVKDACDGASIEEIAEEVGISRDKAESDVQHWMDKGHVYEPTTGKYRTT